MPSTRGPHHLEGVMILPRHSDPMADVAQKDAEQALLTQHHAEDAAGSIEPAVEPVLAASSAR